ncbi:MAG: DUF2330 domain-containing protein [Candidatus Stahlbacteria bacterium]|nr:MAG: DUF2330 domain-containing protein [Candidatus Stahlbacteria bacterium]
MKRVLILSLASAFAVTLWADGGIFPPPGIYVGEPYQYAIIEYEGSQEILHLLINVASDAASFGWIVPFPSKPAIEEDTIAVFEQIEEMCRPSYGGFGCGVIYDGGYYAGHSVKVIEEGSVGILSYEIIKADDPDTLFNWLAENDYWIADSSDTARAREVFSDYIERDWVFVAFSVQEIPRDNSINVQPVKFTFTSSQIVYPMRITSLNTNPEYYYDYGLLIHVIAEHRVKLEQDAGIRPEYSYANKLNSSEYEAVEKNYPFVAEVCKEGDFITRLASYYYDPGDIDSDLVFTYAEDDAEGNNQYYSALIIFPILPFAFVAGLALRSRLRFRKRRKR